MRSNNNDAEAAAAAGGGNVGLRRGTSAHAFIGGSLLFLCLGSSLLLRCCFVSRHGGCCLARETATSVSVAELLLLGAWEVFEARVTRELPALESTHSPRTQHAMASQLQLELIELLQVKLFTIGTQALDLLVGLSSIAEPTLPSGIVVSTLGASAERSLNQ